MARYLIPGVAGFIGARLAEILLKNGHMIIGIDNLNHAYDIRLKQWRLNRLNKEPNFQFHQSDISDWEAVQNIFSQPKSGMEIDAIINLAARAGVRQSVENPWVYLETNIKGTLNLLEVCRRQQIPKFVLASTSSVYGANAPLPTPEEASSDAPLQPYAATKKAAEALCHAYHFLYGLDITIFRYFTVYGPAGRPDMSMFRFTKWIKENLPVKVNGDGEQSRGFTFIDDIVRGTILGLKPTGFEIINLGGHETITINRLIEKLEATIGKKAQVAYLPSHPADMHANWANVEKARRLLDWQPVVTLDEGIAQLVTWYNTEREWASQVNTD